MASAPAVFQQLKEKVLQINSLPVTAEDPVLSKVLRYTMEGWPVSVTVELKLFS